MTAGAAATPQRNCCETIWQGMARYGCSRNGVVERKGKRYCRQHDPVAVDARRKKRDEEWCRKQMADEAAWQRKAAKMALAHASVEAIRQIAAGHNDARGLAQQVLTDNPIPSEVTS